MAFKLSGLLLAAGLAASVPALRAQGSPPMLTDDAETTARGHWQINVAAIVQRTPGLTDLEFPSLDLAYGVTDAVELSCQIPWDTERQAGKPAIGGLGATVAQVKWRFFDQGDQGWKLAISPQITFLDPGSHSDRRGLAAADPGFLLPIEIEKNLGPMSLEVEAGPVFAPQGATDLLGVGGGWIAGLALGREVAPGIELGVEAHAQTGPSPTQAEWTVNAGAQIDLSKNYSLLFSLGRDVRNTLSARVSLLSYIGMQWRI
jgi:hypothetical protein